MSRFTKLDPAGAPLPEGSTDKAIAFLDSTTGLTWAAADASENELNHANAMKAAADDRSCGFDDWRAPTIDELETLRDRTRFNPAADPELGLKSDFYWSSTPGASSPAGYAWGVGFDLGYADYNNQGDTAFVRAVRSARASQ